jgi:positive regulator of sigma E activity
MRSLLIFVAIQIMVYTFGMSDAVTISLIVFGSASAVFVFAYLSAFGKDKRNQKRIVKTILEVQQN